MHLDYKLYPMVLEELDILFIIIVLSLSVKKKYHGIFDSYTEERNVV